MADRLSQLDANQVIRRAGLSLDGSSAPAGGLAVVNMGGDLVPEKYDKIDLTYVAAGNGVGEIETVVYSLVGNTIATLTLAYDGTNKLISVTRS